MAENAYIWNGGVSPHHLKERPAYALSRSWHNDSSAIPAGGPERWNSLGVELKPWRANGNHILVCPNRSFGVPGRMMPPDWAKGVRERLAKITRREIRVRPHPGNDVPRKPLADDLDDAWAVVIWSTSAGVHALVAGIPVICEAPYWICKDAAYWQINIAAGKLEHGPWAERRRSLEDLAWAQWSVEEIATGLPFDRLLRATRESEVTAGA